MEINIYDYVYKKIDGKIFHKNYPERAVPYKVVAGIFGVDKVHIANHPNKHITEDSLLEVMGVYQE